MELSGVARQVAQRRQREMSFERCEPHLLSSWSNCWPLPGEESKYQQQDGRPYDSTNEPKAADENSTQHFAASLVRRIGQP
jgi:hypothetical protein